MNIHGNKKEKGEYKNFVNFNISVETKRNKISIYLFVLLNLHTDKYDINVSTRKKILCIVAKIKYRSGEKNNFQNDVFCFSLNTSPF